MEFMPSLQEVMQFVLFNSMKQYGLKGKIPLIGSGWLNAEDVRPQQKLASRRNQVNFILGLSSRYSRK